MDRSTKLVIELPQDVADSIRARYVKPIDLGFLHSLTQPVTRGVFRRLDALRHDPLDPDRVTVQFNTPLSDWGRMCRIVSTRPELIRRTLEPAHKELIERGYLTSVEYRGRGKKQVVEYTFAPTAPVTLTPEQRELVTHITSLGVARPVAEQLARDIPVIELQDRVALAAAVKAAARTLKNPGGLVVDVIKDRDGSKYAIPENFIFPSAKAERQARVQRRASQEEAQDLLLPPADAQQAWSSLSVILKLHLKPREIAALHELMQAGELDVIRAYRQALSLHVGNDTAERDAFYAQLRQLAQPKAASTSLNADGRTLNAGA